MPDDSETSGLGDDLFASPAPASRDESTVEPDLSSFVYDTVSHSAAVPLNDEQNDTVAEDVDHISLLSRVLPTTKFKKVMYSILTTLSIGGTAVVMNSGGDSDKTHKDPEKQSAPNVPVETAEQKEHNARVDKETQDVAAIDTMIAGIKTQLEDTRLTPDQRQDLEGQLQSFEKQRFVQEAQRLNAEAAGEDVPAHLRRASEDTQDRLKGNN